MPAIVRLLLLLSALLSALSGAAVGARAAQLPVAVNRVAVAGQPVRVTAAIVDARPVVIMPMPQAAAISPTLPAWRLAAPQPLYASRRRE